MGVRLAALWVASTTIGLAAGGFVLHFPGSLGEASWQPGAAAFGGLLGFVTGFGVGVVHWAALRLPRRAGMRLVLAMGIGIAVTHGLQDGAPLSLGVVTVGLVSGLAMAATMAVLFDHRSAVALAAGTIGWGLGQVLADYATAALGMPWHETPIDWSLEHMVAGIVVGLVWGVLTAAVGLPEAIRRTTEAPRATGA